MSHFFVLNFGSRLIFISIDPRTNSHVLLLIREPELKTYIQI